MSAEILGKTMHVLVKISLEIYQFDLLSATVKNEVLK